MIVWELSFYSYFCRMIYTSHIFFRIFCLLLMIHIVALNTCADDYVKFLSCNSETLKSLNIEEESDSKTKTTESDDFDSIDDDYLVTPFLSLNSSLDVNCFENGKHLRHYFYLVSFPQLHYDIQIPPPRS